MISLSDKLPTEDWLLEPKAQQLGARLRDYWAHEGHHDVRYYVVPIRRKDDTARRGARAFALRTNLYNGLPPSMSGLEPDWYTPPQEELI